MNGETGSTIILNPGAEVDSDAELLGRFVARRDEVAFAALVRRHGPMVLGVCRRLLREVHDAEDAFQAVFLVFTRKAGAIRKPERLANWLYGVAVRTALKARSEAARRQARERQVAIMPPPVAKENPLNELAPVLDEELSRLPEKYRLPIVLCGLEGKTNEEAARQLGCPRETLATRLARARARLRARLTRRGLALAAVILVEELSPNLTAATVPPLLELSTVQAGLGYAAGSSAGVSVSVASLTQGVLQAMFLTKLKLTLVVVLTILVAGLSVGLFLSRADGPEKQTTKAPDDARAIRGTWKVIKANKGGVEPPDADEVKKNPWVITADKIIVKRNGEDRESSYKLDPSKKPKAFDLTPLTGPDEEKGKLFQGIYILTGDTLKICITGPGQERPADFKAAGAYQFELRRAK